MPVSNLHPSLPKTLSESRPMPHHLHLPHQYLCPNHTISPPISLLVSPLFMPIPLSKYHLHFQCFCHNIYLHINATVSISTIPTYTTVRIPISPPIPLSESQFPHLYLCQNPNFPTYTSVRIPISPPIPLSESQFPHLYHCQNPNFSTYTTVRIPISPPIPSVIILISPPILCPNPNFPTYTTVKTH